MAAPAWRGGGSFCKRVRSACYCSVAGLSVPTFGPLPSM